MTSEQKRAEALGTTTPYTQATYAPPEAVFQGYPCFTDSSGLPYNNYVFPQQTNAEPFQPTANSYENKGFPSQVNNFSAPHNNGGPPAYDTSPGPSTSVPAAGVYNMNVYNITKKPTSKFATAVIAATVLGVTLIIAVTVTGGFLYARHAGWIGKDEADWPERDTATHNRGCRDSSGNWRDFEQRSGDYNSRREGFQFNGGHNHRTDACFHTSNNAHWFEWNENPEMMGPHSGDRFVELFTETKIYNIYDMRGQISVNISLNLSTLRY